MKGQNGQFLGRKHIFGGSSGRVQDLGWHLPCVIIAQWGFTDLFFQRNNF